ncbi:hypothetical protein [Catellatospora bangladeshensis]|uniref:Uncharacterized protein n=1 Tax=Catellatospora bangladeshensis TaxID=310355 RepID=A0A8J3JK09_9ACTN|nr:hypothetical protein [Catellatospora bangladeshensis]GIF79414.1 hypothetical protein Cba03nite_07630 [Catellatospora bangladeshensis]
MSDDLRRLLGDASAAARPHLSPPGAEAARRTLRRRRLTRASVLAVVAAVLALAGLQQLPHRGPAPTPLVPTPVPGPSTGPSATPSPSPSAAVSASPSPTGQPRPGPSPSRSRSSSNQVLASPAAPPPCLPAVRPRIAGATAPGPGTMTFSLTAADVSRLCPGRRMHISWASYRVTFESRLVLVDSGELDLDATTRTGTGTLSDVYGCQADRYFYLGSHTFPAEIAPNTHLSLPAWSAGRTTGLFEKHYLPRDGCAFY